MPDGVGQMKVVGFCGYSGSGKTTLLEQLIVRFKLAGWRVSVVKHAHHSFDIDHPGKDTYRHRSAGAFEVVVASNQRLAKIREFASPVQPTAHHLIAELAPCDWVFVEGFKHADIPKLEVWRPETGKPVQYPEDPFVTAIVTNRPQALPVLTLRPVLDLDDPDGICAHLLDHADRYTYVSPFEDAEVSPDAAGRSLGDHAGFDPSAVPPGPR